VTDNSGRHSQETGRGTANTGAHATAGGSRPLVPPLGPAQVPLTPSAEERNWAVVAHLGSLLSAWFALGLLAPLLVLLVKGSSSEFIRRHATESLNFQINALVWSAVLVVSMFFLVGFILLPLYGLFYLVQVIVASVRASQGREFRYALTVRLIS
jgi:uncharacterized Tic20 family protein